MYAYLCVLSRLMGHNAKTKLVEVLTMTVTSARHILVESEQECFSLD